MEKYKPTARIVGVLFIVASVTAIVGGSLVELPLEQSDYLTKVSDQASQIVTGMLLLVVQTIAVVAMGRSSQRRCKPLSQHRSVSTRWPWRSG